MSYIDDYEEKDTGLGGDLLDDLLNKDDDDEDEGSAGGEALPEEEKEWE